MKSENDVRVKFSAPLNPIDSENQTKGCRHSNPDICKNMMVENVCAFATEDGVCVRPSSSWKKQYQKLGGGKK